MENKLGICTLSTKFTRESLDVTKSFFKHILNSTNFFIYFTGHRKMIFDPLPHQFDIFLCSVDPRFGVVKLDAFNYCYYYQHDKSVVGTLKLLRVDLQCYRLLQAVERKCNLRTWNWQRILGSKIRP